MNPVLIVVAVMIILMLGYILLAPEKKSTEQFPETVSAEILDHWTQKDITGMPSGKLGTTYTTKILFVIEFAAGDQKIDLLCDSKVYSYDIGTKCTLTYQDNTVVSFTPED